MKRVLTAAVFMVLSILAANARDYSLSTPNSTLVLTAEQGETLYFRYYGTRADLEDVFSSHRAMKTEAFRAFGTHCNLPHACLVKHANGDNATKLVVDKVEETSTETLNILTVTLKDISRPFRVKLYYQAYKDCDIIKMSAEYFNDGKKPIVLQKYMSASLPIKSEDCYLLHLDGDHGSENHETIEPLYDGTKILSTQAGGMSSRNANASFMLGTDGKISETEGNVIAGTLAWTGNFHIEFVNNKILSEPIELLAGINPVAADYTLQGKASLKTPEMIFTYSTKGKGQATRNIHYWARHHQILDGTKQRDLLLNSWEGVRMLVTQDGMNEMMSDFAELGGEMFVMDDGWFGNKYLRTDSQGLGDWEVSRERLPEGIGKLVEYAHSQGLRFGIWIEPEMANIHSELIEKHPDWVLRHSDFEPTYGRGKSQVVLDLTNPKVQDFVFGVVDNLMKENPEISYIKWDYNMEMFNATSPYLPEACKSNIYVDYHLGLENILKRVRAAYPELIIQLCSSGGYRMNYGYMPYFQEMWTSDNTEPTHRIFIQWGALNFYPPNMLAAHVCSEQNKYTQRRTPLKYRFDVASMCRMGMEMVPGHLNEAEKAYAKRAISEYKRLRPLIQQGDLYKLISPYSGNKDYASLMYVNENKEHAVAFVYRMVFTRRMPDKIIKFQGLDPERKYLIREVAPEVEGQPAAIDGKIVSGRYLMEEGIVMKELNMESSRRTPYNDIRDTNDYRSYILELIAQ